MIDISTLPLLKGKKALVTGIANDQSIAYGCAKAFRAFGADLAITYRNEKAKRSSSPLRRNSKHRFSMPLDVQIDGELEAVFETIEKQWGRLIFACIRSPSLRRRTCKAAWSTARRRASCGDGGFLLVFHSHGEACRTADEGRRDAFDHDLLRVPDGGGELQHDGTGEGGARNRLLAIWRPS